MVVAAAAQPHVVLISMDTTRADALSCYAQRVGPHRSDTQTTPVLDSLAASGVRLEHFFAHAPTTLSSHASMLSGLDPHGHGIVRNGFPLDPEVTTLPQVLSQQGWRSVAVLGSAALESSMGLDRGFAVYDDAMPTLKGIMYQDDADGVLARTRVQLEAHPGPDVPLFLFVHFYDPHTPYIPPDAFHHVVDSTWPGVVPVEGEGFRRHTRKVRSGRVDPFAAQRVSELYLAEVAFVDARIGDLLTTLESHGYLEQALVVVTADHGESLSDAGDYTYSHGSNVEAEAMHVPLIVRGYGLPVATGAVVRSQATMNGLASTILAAVGVDEQLGTGVPFWDLVREGPLRDDDRWPERPSRVALVEATRPRQVEADDGWNNRHMYRGITASGVTVVRAPFLGLDWQVQHPSAVAGPELVDELAGRVDAWDSATPGRVQGDALPQTTRRALEALGYLEPGSEDAP